MSDLESIADQRNTIISQLREENDKLSDCKAKLETNEFYQGQEVYSLSETLATTANKSDSHVKNLIEQQAISSQLR